MFYVSESDLLIGNATLTIMNFYIYPKVFLCSLVFSLIISWLVPTVAIAQSYIELTDCGVSYIDPQDEMDNGQNRDTLIYTQLFQDPGFVHDYWVDINAFGGTTSRQGRSFCHPARR